MTRDLGAELSKPYKVNDQPVNQLLELKHGNNLKLFPMDRVSNTEVTQVSIFKHGGMFAHVHSLARV
jgi:hypothetical protein